MAAIRLDAVTLDRGGRAVLAGASFAIAPGEFVAVLGPNGAGKTTLLRAVLGLVPPSLGRIEVFGARPVPGGGGIGYLPQTGGRPALASLRGRDVIAAAWHGARWGLPLPGAAGRLAVQAALDLVDAGGLADRPVGTLSGGERQRLLLAQALLGRPRLLLLDEPLISLDPRRQLEVVALVRRVQQALGLTVLFATHELNPVLPVVDRVLVLGGGQAAIGAVAEVVTGPVLSRLYGTPIEVVRTGNGVLVLAAGQTGFAPFDPAPQAVPRQGAPHDGLWKPVRGGPGAPPPASGRIAPARWESGPGQSPGLR